MPNTPVRLLLRVAWLALTAATLLLLWRGFPYFKGWSGESNAETRTVTPRGELPADEKATIELFEKSRDSVVYISTLQQVMDLWTRNVFSVPLGASHDLKVGQKVFAIGNPFGLDWPLTTGIDGVVILRVSPGSAAASAGLKGATIAPDGAIAPGDIIVAVEGRPVESVSGGWTTSRSATP